MKFVISIIVGLYCGGAVGVALFGEKEIGTHVLAVVGLIVGIFVGLEDSSGGSSGGSSSDHLGCPKGHH